MIYIRTTNFVYGVNTGPDFCVSTSRGVPRARPRAGGGVAVTGTGVDALPISPYVAAPRPVFSLYTVLNFRVLRKYGPNHYVPTLEADLLRELITAPSQLEEGLPLPASRRRTQQSPRIRQLCLSYLVYIRVTRTNPCFIAPVGGGGGAARTGVCRFFLRCGTHLHGQGGGHISTFPYLTAPPPVFSLYTDHKFRMWRTHGANPCVPAARGAVVWDAAEEGRLLPAVLATAHHLQVTLNPKP